MVSLQYDYKSVNIGNNLTQSGHKGRHKEALWQKHWK